MKDINEYILGTKMLKMRFKRIGRKGQPNYRLVVMPSTSRRDGRPISELGFYNPITKEIKLDFENIIKYLNNGVQPTKTIRNLLIKEKIINI
jgi:small subunit ribosomal protein S16